MRLACFRVDSSIKMGLGHVMRCLTLAELLREVGWQCDFFIKAHCGHAREIIERRGFRCYLMPLQSGGDCNTRSDYEDWLGGDWQSDAQAMQGLMEKSPCDLLVYDHYAIDWRWATCMRPLAKKVLAIDDLASRRHDCDYLLDQTAGRKYESYRALINEGARCLLGSEYALLRPEFTALRCEAKRRRDATVGVRRILVAMGGADAANTTCLVVDALRQLSNAANLTVSLVVGKNYPHMQYLRQAIDDHPCSIEILSAVENMAEQMLTHDLAIGAGGTSAWERCCMGLPCVTVACADNQQQVIAELARRGAIAYAGDASNLASSKLAGMIALLVNDIQKWRVMADSAYDICDGYGSVRTVLQLLRDEADRAMQLRAVNPDDRELIFRWQCSPGVRTYARNPAKPTWQEHCAWFEHILANKPMFWLAEFVGTALGFIRLQPWVENERVMEISIVTSPDFQRLGVAALMLQAIKSQYKAGTLMGEVSDENIASRKLFQEAGYEERSPGRFFWR